MISTHLSSKGQVMIPRQICQHQHWESEQELVIIVLMKMKFAIEV